MEDSVSLYIKKPTPLPINPASVLRGRNQSAPVAPNGVPSGLTLTVLSPTIIKIDFVAGSTNEDGFKIERSDDFGSTYNEIHTNAAGIITYNNTGLTGGTHYYYRIRAYKGLLYSEYSDPADIYTSLVLDFPENSEDSVAIIEAAEGSVFSLAGIAPAPTNISIIPNAVVSSPETWYFRVIQVSSSYKRTEVSEEGSYIIGDSTTELLFNCDHINYSTPDLFSIMKGTTSGVYTNIVVVSFTPPTTVVPIADVQLPYDLLTGADLPVGEEGINEFLIGIPLLYPANPDNSLFTIDSDTGELRFITPPDYETPLDIDSDGIYDVLVRVTLGGEVQEFLVSITVTDVEES